jgi:hypothetical protein
LTHIVESGGAAEDQLVAVRLEDLPVDVGLQLLVDEDADGLEAGSATEDIFRHAVVAGGNLGVSFLWMSLALGVNVVLQVQTLNIPQNSRWKPGGHFFKNEFGLRSGHCPQSSNFE